MMPARPSAFLCAAFAGALAIAAGFAALPSAFAQDNVIARVGGIAVSSQELDFAASDLASQFAQVPDDQRRAAILRALIDIKLMAQAADKAGLGKTDIFAERMKFLRDRALHNAWFQQNALETTTEDEVKARYDKEIAALPERKEVRARHILLATRDEAMAVIQDLDAGKDFAAIAKDKTNDPSGTDNGGDLGFFGEGQMVPEFEKAAFALANGAYTKEPVQTQFGWHVIKREEDRVTPPPPFNDVKDQVRQIVLREKYVALIESARKDVSIEILDPLLKEQIEASEKRDR